MENAKNVPEFISQFKKNNCARAHGGEGETAMMFAICPNLVSKLWMEPARSDEGVARYKGLVVSRRARNSCESRGPENILQQLHNDTPFIGANHD